MSLTLFSQFSQLKHLRSSLSAKAPLRESSQIPPQDRYKIAPTAHSKALNTYQEFQHKQHLALLFAKLHYLIHVQPPLSPYPTA
jgi:hypothetical protein